MLRQFAIVCTAICINLALLGQVETARISGTVTDQTGAVIPGVEVAMTHVGTNRQASAFTNEQGRYASVPLAIGEYRVEASLPGFKKSVRTGIRLQVQENVVVDFRLEVGEVTEQVEVVGDAPLLNTAEPSQGQVIDERRVQDLPLNGRDYIQLALLSAGAIEPVGAGRAGGFSTGGQRTTQNNYLLDGIDNNSVELATAGRQAEMVKPSVDAIQEFKVQTNSYSAEFGRAMGAVINVTTKSGTNELHGTVFEFLRNEKLDAKNFFDPADEPRAPFKRNQFGFSLGGPIVKDKTFFFGDFEGTRIRESATFTSTVPTLKMQNGDFSELPTTIFDPATYDPATRTRQPFPGNLIPAERFDPVAKELIDLYPAPQSADLGSNFVTTSPDKEDIDRWDIRVDHSFSSNDSVYYRLSRQMVTFPAALILPAPAFGGGIFDGLTRHWNTGFVWNHVFSPTLLTSTRVGWNQTRFARKNPEAAGEENLSAQFGIQGVDHSIPGGFSTFNISGFRSIGLAAFNGVDRDSQNRQFASDVSWIRGDQTLKFGVNVLRNQNNIFNVRQTNGIFNFNGRFTRDPATGQGGSPMADFLLGIPAGFTRSTPIDVDLRGWIIGGYVQDDWKATQRLTLNLGVRYEVILPWLDTRDRMAQFDLDSNPGSVRLVPAGAEGSGRFSRSLIRTEWNNFAPRIGFAYQLRPNIVVRAGYGLFFEFTEPAGDAEYLIGNPPFAFGSTLSTDGISPAITLSEGAPPDLLTVENATSLSFSSYESEPTRGNAQQWNLNVQYEPARNWLWEVGYFGARGTHLLRRIQGNPAPPGAGNINQKRRFGSIQIPGSDRIVSPLAGVLRHEWSGNSIFHSMQTKLEKRFSEGFTILTSYIFSRTIGDSCGFAGSGNAGGCGFQDANNLRLERAIDNQHQQHRFVTSYVWEMPFGQGQRWGSQWNGAVDAVLGGWSLGGIVTLTSGEPFTLTVSGDPANTGDQNRPVQVGDPERPAGADRVRQFFNIDAFRPNPQFTFGNVGRNTMIGPAFHNFDFSLMKDFQLAEEARLQFRFEAFNFTNTPHFGNPGNALGTATFGRITGAGRPRNLQFGLKLIF